MRDVRRLANESEISSTNGKRWIRITDNLERLAAMLVEEVRDPEVDSLTHVIATDIWGDIKRRLIAWAEMVEEQREAHAREHIRPAV